MHTSLLPRIFDPHHADRLGYWIVLNTDGYWLVPANCGGWSRRTPCAPHMGRIELPLSLATAWWGLLTMDPAAHRQDEVWC